MNPASPAAFRAALPSVDGRDGMVFLSAIRIGDLSTTEARPLSHSNRVNWASPERAVLLEGPADSLRATLRSRSSPEPRGHEPRSSFYDLIMTTPLNEAEREYLKSQPLARLATVDASGAPQNSPVGAFLDEESGDILIGGFAMGVSRKFRNVRANGHVALVVDDLVSSDPWTVRGLEIRGTAQAQEDVDPPMPSMSREVIRITPTWVSSWGVDPENPDRQTRRS